MSTATPAPQSGATARKAPPQDKFSTERSEHGAITLLSLHGTLNEAFEGKKLAESIRTKKVVLNLRDTRRFASWGMSEWMEFLRVNADRDLYLVECSTYAVSQINLITGLLGRAKLVSFYASFVCESCSKELEARFVIPNERDRLRTLPGSIQPCTLCGGQARLEDYPASFFEIMADRPPIDIDDEVLAFLRARYAYDLSPDLSQFRASRTARDGFTYLRLSGSLDRLPVDTLADAAEGTTVVDLEHVLFEPAHAAAWRSYLDASLPRITSMQLLGCPLGFLDAAVTNEDLHGKIKIRSFALPYECLRCETPAPRMVDVAENLEELAGGHAPAARCPTCDSSLVAVLAPTQVAKLRALPARDRDPALEKFLAKARAKAPAELENCLAGRARAQPKKSDRGGRAAVTAIVLGALLVAAIALLLLWKRDASTPAPAVAAVVVDAAPPEPTFARPDWILSDIPGTAYCHDQVNRLMCVGVSTYRPSRDEAVPEANDAALEELVNAIGLKITAPFFRENLRPLYSAVRAKAIEALQAADLDRASEAYIAASTHLRKERARVVDLLRASGGAAVPSQRTDWYWEEYAGEGGKPNEVLVFVRYDIGVDSIRALVEKYQDVTDVLGSSAITAFPSLAWPYSTYTGGAIVTKARRPLARVSVPPPFLVSAVGDQPIVDAPSFARRLEEVARESAQTTLMVQVDEAPARAISIRTR